MALYSKCGRLDLAEKIFDKIRQRDVCRITIILGYAMDVNGEIALVMFNETQDLGVKLGSITFVGHRIFLPRLLY